MKYNVLGDTGVLVSELCMGAMTFGGDGFWGNIGKLQQEEVNAILKKALDGGINFLDTANIYSFGVSETLLGTALRQIGASREDLFIASKVRGRMGPGVNQVGLSRYHVLQSVDASLKRLGTDHIDLLYVHGVDFATSVEEVCHTLHDLVVSGKVRYLGVSNWPAWMVMKALGFARQNGWHRFVAMQYYYAIANRDSERDVLPLALDQKLAFMPWSPLAGGFLSGKFTREHRGTGGESRRDSFDFPVVDKERAFDIIDVLARIGSSHGVSVAEVALAWIRLQAGVTSTIIGAKKLEQLDANIHSVEVQFTDRELEELAAVSKPPLSYPGWMVERQMGDRFASS